MCEAVPYPTMRNLVATDGSTLGDEAVLYAARHTAAFDGTLVIVHVLTPDSELIDGTIVLPGEEAAVEEGERILEGARSVVDGIAGGDGGGGDGGGGDGGGGDGGGGDGGVDVETQLLTGRPADAITEFATEIDADAIYVGHRGLSEEREQVVGSVAKSVVDKATVPVTVIR